MTPTLVGLLNIGGFVIGVVGIVVSVVLAIRSSEKKRPTYCFLTQSRVASSADAPSDIRITYKGAPVDRVSSTFFWFWNAGRRPIRRDDIPGAQPIQLQLRDAGKDVTILDCLVRKVSRPSNNFSAQKVDDATITVTFDFLDHRDGGVLEVQHTGGGLTSPRVSGVILGAPDGVRMMHHLVHPSQVKKMRPGLHPGPGLPGPRRATLLAGLAWSLLGVVFWGASWYATWVNSARDTVPLSQSQIHGVLQRFLGSPAIDSATNALQAANLPHHVSVVRSGAFFVPCMLLTLWLIWGRSRSYPDTLTLSAGDVGSAKAAAQA